jgi:hypothetical protein
MEGAKLVAGGKPRENFNIRPARGSSHMSSS